MSASRLAGLALTVRASSFLLGLSVMLSAQAGTASLSVADAAVKEGNSGITPLNFSVVRSGDSSSNLVVPYTVVPGTAKPGSDYRAPPAGSVLRIPAGSVQGTITVPVIGDTTPEPNETLQLRLGTPAAFDPLADFFVGPAYPAGAQPTSTAIGDFNGDGIADLAVTNGNPFDTSPPNTVSILLGDGHGAFGAPRAFGVGHNPSFVAVGDFNGDGKADLAVANYSDNNVSILLGDGHGGFGAAINFPLAPSPVSAFVGLAPVAIVVADFNGDGKLDLATADSFGNDVAILLGDGHGGFGPPSNLAAGQSPQSLAVGDFNRDGKLDLAVADLFGNSIAILLGDGRGGFGVPTQFGSGSNFLPLSIAVADFNGDGKPDLAVAEVFNNVAILLGDGSGGFGAATEFSTAGPTHVVAGDFNGDGKADLAVTNSDPFGISPPNTVSILLGDGRGGFGASSAFGVGRGPVSIAVGDLNGDGKPDLAVANGDGNDVSILLNSLSFDAVLARRSATGTILNDDGLCLRIAFVTICL